MPAYNSQVIPAMTIFADTETIPTQRLDIVQELTEANHAERDAKLADIAPPKSTKKAESIAEWLATEAPIKRQAIIDEYAAKLAENIHKTCLDGAFGQLAVISLAAGDEEPVNLWDSNWDAPGYEAWLLHELGQTLGVRCRHHRGQTLVGHNITFDRRMIRQRGIIHGVPVHPMFTKEVKPWETDLVFDTMTAWTGDYRLYITMDKLCKALGLAGKGTDLEDGEYIDGSQVWDFVQRGEIAKVAKYCGGDVRRTRELYYVMRGIIPRPPVPAFVPGQPRLIGVDMAAPGGDIGATVAVIDGTVVSFAEPRHDDEPPPADEAPALPADAHPHAVGAL